MFIFCLVNLFSNKTLSILHASLTFNAYVDVTLEQKNLKIHVINEILFLAVCWKIDCFGPLKVLILQLNEFGEVNFD